MRTHERRYPLSYFLMMGCVALLFSSLFAQRAWALKNAENSNVQNILYQAREEAVGLDQDSETMETLVRSDIDWQTHVSYLLSVADHVNRLAAIIDQLQTERVNGSPTQQDAIDRVTPLLREIADNTKDAIKYLNQNKGMRPVTGNYPTWLRENAETAHQLAQLISDIINYGQTKSRLDKLTEQLNQK